MTTPRSARQKTFWKVLTPIVVILAIALAGLYAIKSEFGHAPSPENHVEIQVGNILPDFTLTGLTGQVSHASDLKAKILLVNFWATWCEACMEEMPSIVRLRNTFKNRGFEVVGINLDENPETMIPRAI